MPLFIIMVVAMLMFVTSKLRYIIAPLIGNRNPVEKDYEHQPMVSVLVPCYNEGPTVYDTIKAILDSNYPIDKLEVCAVDDASVDDSYVWLLKAQEDFAPRVKVGRNAKNAKKPQTICNAMAFSKGEIMIEVDSDSIVHPNAIREVAACFADKSLGIVGGVVRVHNVNASVYTMIQSFVYYMQFRFIKPIESWNRTVSCVSGALLAIRRDLLEELDPLIRNRRWFSVPVSEGEDRFLTHQVLLRGYGSYIDPLAECYTEVPATLENLFKQQLRWIRGSMRTFFALFLSYPKSAEKVHMSSLYTLFVPNLVAITALSVIAMSIVNGAFFVVAPIAFIVCSVLGLLMAVLARKDAPSQIPKYPFFVGAFGMWTIASLLLTVLALGTFDLGDDWGTRSKKPIEEKSI